MEEDKNKLNEEYLRASARLDELKGFYSNVAAYVLITPFLVFVNYMTYWEYKWFWFPMIGWGIGVGIHAVVTFALGKDWERRKIEELMKNDKFK